MAHQRTLSQKISASGIGLHSANRVDVQLCPAPIDTGIVFRRLDLQDVVDIPARAALVRDTTLCTALCLDNAKVATVEHLLSALAGLGIDNVVVELNAPEIPIMDGSAAPFVYLIQQAGIQEQDAPKRFIKIDAPIRVEEHGKWAEWLPYHDGCRFDFTIDFNHPVFLHQNRHFRLEFSSQNYIREISRARTFGFLRDIEYLHSHHLALGGSLDNAIVIDDYRIMNEHGLRFEDEFVRHKILDAIGDVYLTGAPILGWYQGYKSGHDLNNKLCLALLNQPDKWHWHTLSIEEALIHYH